MRKSLKTQGAIGFTVDRIEDISAHCWAVRIEQEGKTVVIDAHPPHRHFQSWVGSKTTLKKKLLKDNFKEKYKNWKELGAIPPIPGKKRVAHVKYPARRKSNVNCVILHLAVLSTVCGSMPCLYFDFLRAETWIGAIRSFLEIVNEFKSIRILSFQMFPKYVLAWSVSWIKRPDYVDQESFAQFTIGSHCLMLSQNHLILWRIFSQESFYTLKIWNESKKRCERIRVEILHGPVVTDWERIPASRVALLWSSDWFFIVWRIGGVVI